MAWEALAAAAFGEWNKQRQAEAAQGSPALALAARRASSGGDWIVATGGASVDANRDVLPGVDALPVPIATAGVSGTPSMALAVGLVLLIAWAAAKR